VIHNVKPTILIGTSTHARAFTEDIVKEMAKHVERPIIVSRAHGPDWKQPLRACTVQFPLSNPTALAECDPGKQSLNHPCLGRDLC